MDDNYKITGLAVKQGSGLNANGQIETRMNVSYKVGTHGPFTDFYPLATFTQDEANAGIAKRVAQLRAIAAANYIT
jgi:hypothetical protein